MKVLIVDDDDMVRLICRMHLESTYGIVDVIEVASGSNAVDVLKTHSDFDFIVCDYEMPDGMGSLVYNQLKEKKSTTPFILHTSKELDDISDYTLSENYYYLQKGGQKKEFITLVQKFLSLPVSTPEYSRIRIPFFYRFNETLCQVYLQLGPKKYLKIFDENQKYDIEDIEKYASKDIEFLYIKEEDYLKFTLNMEGFSFLKFNEKYAASDPKNETLIRQTHALIHDTVLRFGVNESAINLVKTSVTKIKEVTGDRGYLFEMLRKARKNRDYIYDHSYMIACIATQICKEMSWATPENIDKLCYAAIFHDLYLPTPRLAKVKILDSTCLKDFSKHEIQLVKDHITKISDDFKKIKNFPFEIENIIEQHHETPESTGFPRGLDSTRISPLSCIFILSHEYVDLVFEEQMDPINLKSLVIKLDGRFNKGNFKEPLIALKGMLSE